jgi:hypothetical protein
MMGAAMLLFFLAALIEGFLSPSTAPYEIKALVAAVSTALMLCYVALGLRAPAGEVDGSRPEAARATG